MKAFFLFLDQHTVNIFDGVKTRNGYKGPYIQLPTIEGVPTGKFSIPLDIKNPAVVDKKGKIHEIFLRIYGGQRFRDAGIVTACFPKKETGAIAIFTSKRWPELGLKIISGKPNGEFPGVQILNEGDTVGFIHTGISYQLTNSGGEPWLTREKKTAVKQTQKNPKPEAKIDNRQKIVERPKIVGEIKLPETTVKKIPVSQNSQIAKFEKKYGKRNGGATIGEMLKDTGVRLAVTSS